MAAGDKIEANSSLCICRGMIEIKYRSMKLFSLGGFKISIFSFDNIAV